LAPDIKNVAPNRTPYLSDSSIRAKIRVREFGSVAGMPDFSCYNIPKREKHTKLPQNVPNGYEIYQMSVK
jgi:hypothetical protein